MVSFIELLALGIASVALGITTGLAIRAHARRFATRRRLFELCKPLVD